MSPTLNPRTLRLASITSASIGLFLNTITIIVNKLTVDWHAPKHLSAWAFLPLILTILGNYIILYFHAVFKTKHDIPANLLIIVDDCAFLAFLALLIANGIIIQDLGWSSWVAVDKIQMLTYNSMPWIFCGGIHLLLALQGAIDVLGLKLPKRNSRCADCHRKIEQGKGRAAGDGAGESLLRAEDDSDEDVEANA